MRDTDDRLAVAVNQQASRSKRIQVHAEALYLHEATRRTRRWCSSDRISAPIGHATLSSRRHAGKSCLSSPRRNGTPSGASCATTMSAGPAAMIRSASSLVSSSAANQVLPSIRYCLSTLTAPPTATQVESPHCQRKPRGKCQT